MITITFGIRFTKKPIIMNNWFSLFFVHFRIIFDVVKQTKRLDRSVKTIPNRVADVTKRKTLAPGNRGLNEFKPKTEKPRQPSIKKYSVEQEAKNKSIYGLELKHKFFGSQLMLNNKVIVGGLGKKLHTLEILPYSNVIYIDNCAKEFSHSDVMALKAELSKLKR